MRYFIKVMTEENWEEVSRIYKEGIDTKIATFQNKLPTWEEWNKGHLEYCRFIITDGEAVIGWVALSPTSSRCVYKGVAELSIYISKNFKGKGLGTILLNKVIEESERYGIWTLQSSIINENFGSIKLHEKCGFRKVGIREKIAKMDNGSWKDVTLMERRSSKVGLQYN
ncbi:GNAT family N-acetyltransferase [Clostridium nigeriense]|uniref:GNAT family N-acetyltransferase n=1 Tax=Clostridium nigeriense TaxID=1805470 RepID=UPI000830F85E|nr:GNAT family N-acetyltransferase [Clostridium nigeriense]